MCKISPINCSFVARIIRRVPICGDAKPPETHRHHITSHHITIPLVPNQIKHVFSNDCARLVTNFPAVSEINKGCVYYDRNKSARLLTINVNEVLVIIFYLHRFLHRPF